MTNKRVQMWEDGEAMLRHMQANRLATGLRITEDQYRKAARLLDLPAAYIRKRVEFYLFDFSLKD